MKTYRFILIFAQILLFTTIAYAQDPRAEYLEFIKKQRQEYKDFRQKENEAFASFLKNYWQPYEKEKPIDAPRKPEPEKPIVYTDPLPEVPAPATPNVPTVPPRTFDLEDIPRPVFKKPTIKQDPENDSSFFTLSFYGVPLRLPLLTETPFRLKGITEKDIASAWMELSKTKYRELVDACLKVKNDLQICDWGYLLLIQQISHRFCGNHNKNENAFMQMFLLCQSGYKAKNGRSGDELILLVPTDCMLYGTLYMTIGNEKFFLVDNKNYNKQPIYTYEKDFSHATQRIKMDISHEQYLGDEPFERTLEAKKYPVTLTVLLNKKRIEFYKNYPQCESSIYARAAVSQDIYQSVIPPLHQAIQGKTESEAANILLNFVQTAFSYQTDQQQMGYEKPFFVEETFFYPYSDCEDRAILYAFLVRELLQLKVILVEYPNHLATAVLFNEEVNGNFVDYSGKKYLICDPTYINAPIGKAMPQFKNANVKIIAPHV